MAFSLKKRIYIYMCLLSFLLLLGTIIIYNNLPYNTFKEIKVSHEIYPNITNTYFVTSIKEYNSTYTILMKEDDFMVSKTVDTKNTIIKYSDNPRIEFINYKFKSKLLFILFTFNPNNLNKQIIYLPYGNY